MTRERIFGCLHLFTVFMQLAGVDELSITEFIEKMYFAC